ncbi:hypothetical protein ACFQAS_04115 [Halopenitus salinus]|uniref:Uncharacterized protein n=1 Tax=Halopenitus salinus TaxID=1198295 RepID=A0ABD5UQ57_9EURY
MSFTSSVSNPVTTIGHALRGVWRDLLSVYCANTPTWRWLKSGTLVVFGFFLWTGSSVLSSYRPDWGFLSYTMAYGFVVIAWGPFTHLVVVPTVIRLRRTAEHPAVRTLVRHGSKLNFGTFLLVVVVLGTFTPGVMALDYSSPLSGGDSPDAGADVICETSTDGETIACHLENVEGTDHVVVRSGGENLRTLEEPPYAFELRRDELTASTTGEQFVVELRDENGETLRRYIRTPA